jgi:hypothetical protein
MILFIISLSVRLVPLHFSSLPYNVDGFPLTRISEIIIENGSIPSSADYEGLLAYNMKLPVFSTLLSCFSIVLGVQPLKLLPYFCAMIGSLIVIFIYALTLKLTKNTLASFSAGLFAALTGLFVYATTAAKKQLLAMFLLVFIFYLYPNRKDWRYRLLLCMCVILMPFLHHLTTMIALLTLSLALAANVFRHSKKAGKEEMIDFITGPMILLISIVYYKHVNMEIFSEVIDISDAILLLSVFVLATVAAIILSSSVQTRPWFFFKRQEGNKLTLSCILDEKILALVIGIAALYFNSKFHIFLGGPLTSDTFLRLLLSYMVLLIFGMMGLNVIRYTKFQHRYFVIAMFLAPISVMVFALLRGLDVFNLTIVYRSYNFIDIPMAIACGVGIAYVYSRLRRYSNNRKEFFTLPAGLLIIFFVLCASALPLAYENEKAFGIQVVTYEYEFEAMQWASDAGIDQVTTDARYGDVIEPYFGILAEKTGPWKIERGSLQTSEIIFISNYWTEGGAEMSIMGRVVFEPNEINQVTSNCNVMYVGGPTDREVIIAVVR